MKLKQQFTVKLLADSVFFLSSPLSSLGRLPLSAPPFSGGLFSFSPDQRFGQLPTEDSSRNNTRHPGGFFLSPRLLHQSADCLLSFYAAPPSVFLSLSLLGRWSETAQRFGSACCLPSHLSKQITALGLYFLFFTCYDQSKQRSADLPLPAERNSTPGPTSVFSLRRSALVLKKPVCREAECDLVFYICDCARWCLGDDLREEGETETETEATASKELAGDQYFDRFIPSRKYREILHTLPVKCLDAYF